MVPEADKRLAGYVGSQKGPLRASAEGFFLQITVEEDAMHACARGTLAKFGEGWALCPLCQMGQKDMCRTMFNVSNGPCLITLFDHGVRSRDGSHLCTRFD